MSALQLQLLGGFCLRDAEGEEIRIAARKARALIAYAAFRAPAAQSRGTLARLLWEAADDEFARSSLRQALAAIRKSRPASAQAALIADNDSVRLDDSWIQTDIACFRESIRAGTQAALQQAATHYRGELLEGFDARSTAFDEWVSNERLALRLQISAALQRLADLCAASGDIDAALVACTRLTALDPLKERAHRQLMELHARRRSYGEALRQYRICRDILRRELDVAPEPATEALYRDCMRRRRAGTNVVAVEDPPDALAMQATTAVLRPQARPQLRDATILVTRLEGLLDLEAHADPEESHALSADFEQRVQRVVQEYGGRSDRRVGATVLSVFGIPYAYGTEPQRAVRSAMRLREEIDGAVTSRHPRLRLRFGIAQGQVLQSAALFPLTGRPSHLAHALASAAADGQILLADELRLSLSDVIEAERVPVSPDSPDLSAAWALRGTSFESTAATRPFVGRRPELAMILAAFDRCVMNRHGRVIVIRGEPGIGKSRLADAAGAVGRERHATVHCAHVFDFGQSPGRRPIAALALGLLGLSAESSGPQRAAAVLASNETARGGIDQRIFLSDLVDAPLEPALAALEQAMDVTTRQRGRSQALAQLVEAAARNPLLLIVEDVHWADTDELARLAEVAAIVANCRALLILTTRIEGDPIGATWRARTRGCPVTTIDLAPLAPDESQELGSHYPDLPHAVVESCVERAEGHPLFLDQLLRAASAGHSTLPGSVRTLVIARADRLTSQDHHALQAAAVLGHRFDLRALRHLVDADDFDPQSLLDTALLQFDGADLQFAHALFRDAIYESTLRSHRRELHLRAAQWFADADAALHADHLAAAQDERATAAYLAAAHAEQSVLRFERALSLAIKAKHLCRDAPVLHEASLLVGELQLQLGRTHDELATYRESQDFAVDQPGHGQAWLGVASALRVMDRHEEALDALDQAELAMGSAASAQTLARISTLKGNLCFPLGRFAACLEAHEQAYRYAMQANSPLDLARALGGLGDAYYQRGRMLTAREHFSRCAAQARDHGLVSVLLGNLPMLAITQTYCGDVPANLKTYAEALELAQGVGDLRSSLLVHLGSSTSLLMQGQYTHSRQRILEAIKLAIQLGTPRFHAESLGVLAILLQRNAEDEAALGTAREALRLGRETGMSYNGPVLLSVVAGLTPDASQRTELLAEGEALLVAGCVSHSYFEFYANAIEVSLRTQSWAEARRYALALEEYTHVEPLPWTTLLIERGRLLADVGEGLIKRTTAADLARLHADCVRMNTLGVLPAIEAAM